MPKSALINFLAIPHLKAFVWVDTRDLVGNKVASRVSSVELPMPLYCQHFACCAAARNNSRARVVCFAKMCKVAGYSFITVWTHTFPSSHISWA